MTGNRAMTTQAVALRGQPSAHSPLSRGEIINELSSCLALVKPVGMSDAMATEWLAVAAGELLDLTRNALKAGCAHARRTCSHHAQIVPTVLAEAERSQMVKADDRFLDDWNASLAEFLGKPKLLSGKSEVQQLIEATANDLKAG